MEKQSKPPESSSAGARTLRHQKLCLSIDVKRRMIYGLMPSHNGLLTISCIRTLTQIALKMSASMSLDRVVNLITSFQNDQKTQWRVQIEASGALLTLEFYQKGLDAALSLFLGVFGARDIFARAGRKAYNNVYLRHHLFCMLQIIAGRPPTHYGVPCVQPQDMMEHLDMKAGGEQMMMSSFFKLRVSKAQVPFVDLQKLQESTGGVQMLQEPPGNTPKPQEPRVDTEKPQEPQVVTHKLQDHLGESKPSTSEALPISHATKDTDTVSTGHE